MSSRYKTSKIFNFVRGHYRSWPCTVTSKNVRRLHWSWENWLDR